MILIFNVFMGQVEFYSIVCTAAVGFSVPLSIWFIHRDTHRTNVTGVNFFQPLLLFVYESFNIRSPQSHYLVLIEEFHNHHQQLFSLLL